MSDLFSHQRDLRLRKLAPLADRLRPRSLDEFVGQEGILGPGRLLRRAIAADRVGNLILHGPPGVGKTTLARIIAGTTRAHFSSLNAVLAGVKDLRTEVEAARQRLEHHGLRTTLFIDEVHRFNTAQQDALLPWVENGTVNLIGATTENPFFEVNKALVSRSRLFRMQPLEPLHLRQLLERALADGERGYGDRTVVVAAEAADHLVDVAGGDARSLLNALELAVETTEPGADGAIRIDLAIAEESIQQRAVLYDKQGDAHFDTISAFIKSLRGSDADAALFWLARMVEAGENPRFIFRRMLIAAGEDVGLADPQAIVVVQACAAAFERVGLPEGLYPLAQAALYLAGAEKSNSILGFFDAVKTVRSANRQQVPAHLRDASRDGRAFGDGVGYRYPHAYGEHWVAQQYLPSQLQGEVFWQPGQLGWEGGLRQRLQQRRAAQLAAAAETAHERGEVLSSGPDDAQLEHWLRRQAASEGARLDSLRRRFWDGAQWQRHDRVLLLDGRSLLWGLDPLEATPEGGLTIQVSDGAVAERLRAQLQVLDSLRRPELVVCADPDPQRQAAACGRTAFEWIAMRRVGPEPAMAAIERWLRAWMPLLARPGELRLLFSEPLLGPMSALRNSSALGPDLQEELRLALAAEARAVRRQGLGIKRWQKALAGEGLELQVERWNETLELELSETLLSRWLDQAGSYRRQLKDLSDSAFAELARVLRRSRGLRLPQELRHTLVVARFTRGRG